MRAGVLLLGVFGLVGPPAFGALCDTTGPSTPLANAAGNLDAGEWCELATTGDDIQTNFFCCGSSVERCMTYADSMEWDGLKNEIRFVGQAHGGSGTQATEKHLRYAASTNAWTDDLPTPQGHSGTSPTPSSSIGHGYDHNALDPSTGDAYYRIYGGKNFRRWNGSSWSDIENYPWDTSITGGVEWFPDRDELVFSDGKDYISKWKAGSGWSQIGSANFGNSYHLAAEYNPVHKLVWLVDGNGGTTHYKYESNGTLTQLPAGPGDRFGVTDSLTSVDPVGGDFILFDYSEQTWYAYDIIGNSWNAIGHSMPPLCGGNCNQIDNLEASIEEYGVLVFVSWDKNATYVYKHAGSSDPPPIPPPPQGVEPN